MTPERWQEIERLYHMAREQGPEQQAALLEKSCGSDESLRKEVESLLACRPQAENFIETSAMAKVQPRGAIDLVGQTILHYRITAKIGAGGMGEVYRAHDGRLKRDVAIKVLPDDFAGDAGRMARFDREARLLASLSHPNISAIHGLEQYKGKRFLVLELVEGQTLAERLKKGRIPLEETLDICRQIAEGLEAAHEKGVIHRDVKPANVQVTPEGRAKILDFGLGLALHHQAAAADLSNPPTVKEEVTCSGVVLGTAAYMSPEQASGKTVDKRTDIWAFGCLLFECLAGNRPFKGDSMAETVVAILKSDPDWVLLPADTPPFVRSILRRCLQKDLGLRFHDIADVRLDLVEAPTQTSIPDTGAASRRLSARLLVVAVAISLVIGGMIGIGVWRFLRPVRFDPITTYIKLEQGYRLGEAWEQQRHPGRTAMTITPDGHRIVYSAIALDDSGTDKSMLFVREVGQLHAASIKGTEGAQGLFLSPDGRWIGFWADGKLMKMAIEGGVPIPLCESPVPFGACWSNDGRIVFAPGESTGLSIVAARGGPPEPVTRKIAGESSHRLPYWLPDGKSVLFTIMASSFDLNPKLAVVDLKSGKHRVLIEDAADPRLTPAGHLLFTRRGMLMAVPFEANGAQVSGQPVPILPEVMQSLNMLNGGANVGAAQFTFSNTGSLVYASGGIDPDIQDSLVWVDMAGKATEITPTKGQYFSPRLSPDGKRIVYLTFQRYNIWVHDLAAGTAIRLPTDGLAFWPIWKPGGAEITFCSGNITTGSLCQTRADGTGKPERLTTSDEGQVPGSWSTDGKALAFIEISPSRGRDIWIFRPEDRSVTPFLDTKYTESYPEFSPDGRWLAFTSDESGREQVYVTPFPGPGPKVPVSIEGGWQPFWARSGKRIFFCRGGKQVWAADILRTDPVFQAGKPRLLFQHAGGTAEGGYMSGRPNRAWDISLDDRLFLTTRAGARGSSPGTEMILVTNWFEELERLCPTGK